MKAIKMMIGEQDTLELVLIASPGSSGARVSIFRHSRTNFLYAVKCVNSSRVSLVDEIGKRETLMPYLYNHLPRVLWCQVVDDFEVMISECRSVHTLHHLIVNSNIPQNRLLAVWKDVVESLVVMWKTSQHQFQESLCPRYFSARLKRIMDGVGSSIVGGVKLSNCWNLPVVVNGNEYASISESFECITHVKTPTSGVVCHGDPQPSNIVVSEDGKWYCVDWEWSGSHHDWRMMIAHLYGWWSTRCIVLASESVVHVEQRRLVIEYDAFIPDHLQSYQEVVLSAASMMFGGFPDEETVRDINRFLSLLYFGELRFLHLWGREAFLASVLAQAVITANELGWNESNRAYQFSKRKE
jgi:serine/threonine protein kinase